MRGTPVDLAPDPTARTGHGIDPPRQLQIVRLARPGHHRVAFEQGGGQRIGIEGVAGEKRVLIGKDPQQSMALAARSGLDDDGKGAGAVADGVAVMKPLNEVAGKAAGLAVVVGFKQPACG